MDAREAIEMFLRLTRISDGNKWEQAYDTAITALNKQVPEKAVTNGSTTETSYCPKCEYLCYNYVNYCEQCGQKLDWSDENE